MATHSNSTVLGVASLTRTLPVVGLVLMLLFVFVKPEATQGFSFLERLLYWTAHIGLGLVSVLTASRLLRPAMLRAIPLWAAVMLTGLAGAALLAPVYVFLETLTPASIADAPDDWLDAFAASGTWQSVVAEFIEVAPMYLAAWFAVNLPLILGRPEFHDHEPDPPGGPGGGPGAAERREPAAGSPATSPVETFLALLPKSLGRDVIAVSSDMHYLHVHTTKGKCMVLGTLRDAAAQLGDAGMQVHRSHWVAHDHVRKIARRGSTLECVMSNGLRLPVSRRNRSKVVDWYGQAGNVVSIASRQTG